MARPLLQDGVTRAIYAVAAPLLLLSMNALVWLTYRITARPLALDATFWLLPLRRLAMHGHLAPTASLAAFAFSLAVAGALATLSYRRASQAGQGFVLAALVVVPVVQIVATAVLAVLPASSPSAALPREVGRDVAAILQGLFAGVAIIVAAVFVSASLLGAYGWGLFVLTPFFVGFITAYLANRRTPLTGKHTLHLVIGATALGCLALVALALEGLVCIILAAPLGAAVAAAGGLLGRAIAERRRGAAPLMSVAILPLVFAFEAATPPDIVFTSNASIDIAAPPAQVWRAVTHMDSFGSPPGLLFRAGLAYPIRAEVLGGGVGATRIGVFSTGIARERITEWQPERRIAFAVLDQPPSMAEFSPYPDLQTRHLRGYFEPTTRRFHCCLYFLTISTRQTRVGSICKTADAFSFQHQPSTEVSLPPSHGSRLCSRPQQQSSRQNWFIQRIRTQWAPGLSVPLNEPIWRQRRTNRHLLARGASHRGLMILLNT